MKNIYTRNIQALHEVRKEEKKKDDGKKSSIILSYSPTTSQLHRNTYLSVN